MNENEAQAQLAKKYAQAFINSYSSQITADDHKKIPQLQDFFRSHKKSLGFLWIPHITDKEKITLLTNALVGKFGLSSIFEHLIKLLVMHKRGILLVQTLAHIDVLYKKKHNILAFAITSSHHLPETAQQSIVKFLAQQTGCAIMYTYTVDTRLIAGLRLQSDALLWEFSIAKQLQSISQSLFC